MKTAVLLLLLAASAWAAAPARAEEPSPALRLRRQEASPLALALGAAIGPELWAQVKLSTDGPVVEMTRLVRQGYYKHELIELVLMSARAHRPLKEALEKRKKGAELSRIAFDFGLDYDRLYEAADALEELIDRDYLPRYPQRRPRLERED